VGCVTAFCGPLAFIGLSAPHIARMFTRSDVHSVMLLNTMFIGVIVCLGSLFLVHTPWFGFQLPLNAVLSIFGAPVVIWLLIRRPLYLEL
ncbi:MAG: iron chelate uptake ABC transporter family permease subunit, partial [Flavobacteriales bacterium]|nr:iron chelate uptake ABC transporter family permease subunit [Flavobacteriales bacterium]